MKKKVNCQCCGKEIETTSYRISKGRGKYCSKRCMYKYRKRPSGLHYTIKRENPAWFKEGHIPHNKGIPLTEEVKEKISCSKRGKHYSIETEFKSGDSPWNRGKEYPAISGENHWNWKGGVTPLHQQIRHLEKYKLWILEIFKRDNYTCQICQIRGYYLHVHHINQFNDILLENNIQNIDNAISCKELWDISNGITLCTECHRKIHFGEGY